MPPATPLSTPTLVLIMGVAGSGKSTVGQQLAQRLGWPYHEADDYHNPTNKEKMARGIPLDDADRAPWLAAIRDAMTDCLTRGQNAVFTCSALKARYRHTLCAGLPGVQLVHLTGSPELLRSRLQGRSGHYMKPAMLDSQLAALEVPTEALSLDIIHAPDALVEAICQHLRQ